MDKNIKNNLLSIVIPCYNDYLYINDALNSALSQTYTPKEVIVVDDGSTAKTKTVLQNFKSGKIRIISQDNKGTSSARNRGIELANGRYILVLDSDDYFEPEFSEKAIAVFKRDEGVKLVTCYAKWFNDNQVKKFKPRGGTIKKALLGNVAMGSAMFEKKDWLSVKGYDEKMKLGFEDWEFYLRLLRSGGKAYVINEQLFNYRNKERSRNEKANLKKYDILEYIYNKHADLYKEHFSLFIHEWLKSNRRSEAFKQQVMDSLDYKIGNKILKPFRFLGLFKRKQN